MIGSLILYKIYFIHNVYKFLGPVVESLNYWGEWKVSGKGNVKES